MHNESTYLKLCNGKLWDRNIHLSLIQVYEATTSPPTRFLDGLSNPNTSAPKNGWIRQNHYWIRIHPLPRKFNKKHILFHSFTTTYVREEEARPGDGVPCDAGLSSHAVPYAADDAPSVEEEALACVEDERRKMPPTVPTRQLPGKMFFSSS